MQILQLIEGCVCKERPLTHGEAEDNFTDIADIWNILLRRKLGADAQIGPLDVAACMIAVKLARMSASPENLDHWVDAGGYATCGGGIILKTHEHNGDRH